MRVCGRRAPRDNTQHAVRARYEAVHAATARRLFRPTGMLRNTWLVDRDNMHTQRIACSRAWSRAPTTVTALTKKRRRLTIYQSIHLCTAAHESHGYQLGVHCRYDQHSSSHEQRQNLRKANNGRWCATLGREMLGFAAYACCGLIMQSATTRQYFGLSPPLVSLVWREFRPRVLSR